MVDRVQLNPVDHLGIVAELLIRAKLLLRLDERLGTDVALPPHAQQPITASGQSSPH